MEQLPPGVNPGQLDPWSVSTFNVFPNFVILLYERGWYLTYHYWPTSHGTHDWEMDVLLPGVALATERIQHEVTSTMSKEAGIQDMATLDGTQRGLASRATDRFPLSDQEITVRHFHKVVGDWVDVPAGGRRSTTMTDAPLPDEFSNLEPFAAAGWCVESERERYSKRLASAMPELLEFYDAAFSRLREIIDHLDQFPLDDLPERERNLLHLVYSLIQVSLAVDMWGQPEVVDSGNAASSVPSNRHRDADPVAEGWVLTCTVVSVTPVVKVVDEEEGCAEAQAATVTNRRLVTGGGSGIGEATCHHLAEHGHRIAALDRDGDGADRVTRAICDDGGDAPVLTADVTDRAVVDAAFDEVRETYGPIEILVTSAGVCPFTPFADITLDEWHYTIDVNLTGTFHCCQAALPDMTAAEWGRIVMISSSSAQRGAVRAPHYPPPRAGSSRWHAHSHSPTRQRASR